MNKKGFKQSTPLIRAASNSHTEVAKMFLENGANPNIFSESGDTPLHQACQNGNLDLTECLLDNGAAVLDQ